MKCGKITIVYGDDWEGLYLNGVLVTENHSLHVGEVLEALEISCGYEETDREWMDERRCLPRLLDDCKITESL